MNAGNKLPSSIGNQKNEVDEDVVSITSPFDTDNICAETNDENDASLPLRCQIQNNTNDETEVASDDPKLSPKRSMFKQEEGTEENTVSSGQNEITHCSLPHDTSFASQLMQMLISESNCGSESIKWLPEGNGFEILDQNIFEKDIIPIYFRMPCIFQSFIRRLYRWGFHQTGKKKSGHYVFTHKFFHRDNDFYKHLKPTPRTKMIPKPASPAVRSSSVKDFSSLNADPTKPSSDSNMGTSIRNFTPSDSTNIPQSNASYSTVDLHHHMTAFPNYTATQILPIISSYYNSALLLSSLQASIANTSNYQVAFRNALNQVPPNISPMQFASQSSLSQAQMQPFLNMSNNINQSQVLGLDNAVVKDALHLLSLTQQPILPNATNLRAAHPTPPPDLLFMLNQVLHHSTPTHHSLVEQGYDCSTLQTRTAIKSIPSINSQEEKDKQSDVECQSIKKRKRSRSSSSES